MRGKGMNSRDRGLESCFSVNKRKSSKDLFDAFANSLTDTSLLPLKLLT
jgi:hypothetical protein